MRRGDAFRRRRGHHAETGVENLKTLARAFAADTAAERNEMVDVAEFYERPIQGAIKAGGEK